MDVSADLLKRYHQDLVFNYSEYPTKDHWRFDFNSDSYKQALLDWFPRNKDKKIFFYVHIPFCEELCYFCTCSKLITKNYARVKSYLSYLHKEIDLLCYFLTENNISLNVGTVFFGGGSPTILNEDDLRELVKKLHKLFDWSNVEFFTIEADPRHLDEKRLIYNHEVCGANRISFGMQDLDAEVQRRVNRIQPIELFESLLTTKIREYYKEIAVDLLIGQPGQTVETMAATCDGIVKLEPTLVQLSLMAYKPWIARHQLQMLSEGPLPDWFERKALLEVIRDKLDAAGYIRTGFECYSTPSSPMTQAYEEGQAHYGASGHQPGGKVNFIAVGSSSMSNLGNEYYAQNFYDLPSYQKAVDRGVFPIFRGMNLSEDDKIRQHATQQIRSYFQLDFQNFEEQFGIDAKHYFANELEALKEFEEDKLVLVCDNKVALTKLGQDFVQRIMNVFDRYDPPAKSAQQRLEVIREARDMQRAAQERLVATDGHV